MRYFKNINDWLRFAEQKHAGLLILNGGILWSISRILSSPQYEIDHLIWIVAMGHILTATSSLVCVFSFLPILKYKLFSLKQKNSSDNCMYFADIAKYDKRSYLSFLSKNLELSNKKYSDFELDFSCQIVINSRIALGKYEKFKFSSILTMLAIIFYSLFVDLFYLWRI